MSSKGQFFGFKSAAEKVDKEIEMLEKEVSFGLADFNSSNFSADAADEVLEEVQEMKKTAKDLVAQLSERVSNMESFLEGVMHTAAEVEEGVKQVEDFASKYGYTPQDRLTLEQAFTQFIASAEKSVLEEGEEGAPHPVTSVVVERVDSPNLLTIGLTKQTLGKLGFRFKEDLVEQRESKTQKSQPSAAEKESTQRFRIPGKALTSSSDVSKPMTPSIVDPKPSDEDDDFSPVSILKSTKPAELSPPDFSFIEISPGLVVKRPSTRVTPKFDEDASVVAAKKSPEKIPARNACPECSPGGTPMMPTLKTFKWTSQAAAQQISTEGSSCFSKPVNQREDLTGTPPTPDLQTVDLRKLLHDGQIKNPAVLAKKKKESTTPDLPELSQDGKALIARSHHRSAWNKENSNWIENRKRSKIEVTKWKKVEISNWTKKGWIMKKRNFFL